MHAGYPIVAMLKVGQLEDDGEIPGYDTKTPLHTLYHITCSKTHMLMIRTHFATQDFELQTNRI